MRISSGPALFVKPKSIFTEKGIIFFLEIITFDPSLNTIDNPDLTVLNFKGNSFGTQRIKGFRNSLILVYTVCGGGH